jgi:hypothetical protein
MGGCLKGVDSPDPGEVVLLPGLPLMASAASGPTAAASAAIN